MKNLSINGKIKIIILIIVFVIYLFLPFDEVSNLAKYIPIISFLFATLATYLSFKIQFKTKPELYDLIKSASWNDNLFDISKIGSGLQFLTYFIICSALGTITKYLIEFGAINIFGLSGLTFGFGLLLARYLILASNKK